MKPISLLFWAFCLATAATTVTAAEFFVSPTGDDENPGTKANPFATIQAGVNRLQAGDALVIREGVYREAVTFPESGTQGSPITVKAFAGERVVVTGCDPVAEWSRQSNGVWKAPMPWTLGPGRNQVFLGDQVLIEARHPNTPAPELEMYVSGLSPLWPTFGEFSIPQETRVLPMR